MQIGHFPGGIFFEAEIGDLKPHPENDHFPSLGFFEVENGHFPGGICPGKWPFSRLGFVRMHEIK